MHKPKCVVLPLLGIIKNPGFVSSSAETFSAIMPSLYIIIHYKPSQISVVCYHGKFVRKLGKKNKDGAWQLEY